MPKRNRHKAFKSSPDYKVRIMSCIIIAELMTIGLFNFWPAPDKQPQENNNFSFDEDVILMNEAIVTRQESRPPPPPKPQVPIPVPNDQIIEDEVVTFEDVNFSDFSDSLSTAKLAGAGDSDQIAENPQNPPNVVRIVEATTPQAAKDANIKAEVTVNLLVNETGGVEDASITNIQLYEGGSSSSETVDSIGFGIPEATLQAALQWKFQPAQNNGKPVKAYSRQVFTFGF